MFYNTVHTVSVLTKVLHGIVLLGYSMKYYICRLKHLCLVTVCKDLYYYFKMKSFALRNPEFMKDI